MCVKETRRASDGSWNIVGNASLPGRGSPKKAAVRLCCARSSYRRSRSANCSAHDTFFANLERLWTPPGRRGPNLAARGFSLEHRMS